MDAEITKREEIDGIKTKKYGELRENDRGNLTLENDRFDILIFDKEDGTTMIKLGWNISRPGHDHGNSPEIRLEIPKDGVCEPDCTCQGKTKDRDARLIIENDSGHLSCEVCYQDYVWGPPTPIDLYKAYEEARKKGEKK